MKNNWNKSLTALQNKVSTCVSSVRQTELKKKMPWWCEETEKRFQAAKTSPAVIPYQSFYSEFMYRWTHDAYRNMFYLRFCTVFCVFGGLFLINIYPGISLFEVKNYSSIYDRFHELLSSANEYFRVSLLRQSILILIASFMMDVMIISTWLYWMAIGDSFRLPVVYAIFFGFRSFLRNFSILPYPPHFTWTIPTFNGVTIPSLVVQYQSSDDFFYSGHIGCGIICISEFLTYKCWFGVIMSTVIVIFEAVMMLITRVHYTIDMVAGAIIASWIFMLCDKIMPKVDNYFGFPSRPVLLSQESSNPIKREP